MAETLPSHIDNPKKEICFNFSFSEMKEHVYAVVHSFQNEYKIISESESKILILYTPLTVSVLPDKDQLIATELDSPGNYVFSITNQYNKIESFSELERDKTSLNVFTALIDKSINGSLSKSVRSAEVQKKTELSTKAILQLISLGLALYLIFMGMRGCSF